jgi:hypothetical protein
MNSQIQDAANSRIISISLHHLDLDQKVCNVLAIPLGTTDLEGYLSELLTEIGGKPRKREYQLASEHTQASTALRNIFSEQSVDGNEYAEGLAQRLLLKELETEEAYGHLARGASGHVKRGSFLQFVYRESDGSKAYLGVKVEHQSFLDEVDFTRKIGLGESDKVYKACKISFDANGRPVGATVLDTNSKPSVYWWRSFWELIELRSDDYNTENAVKEVVNVVGRLKRKYPSDYTLLRNAAIAAFKQEGAMDFNAFITQTFSTYVPMDEKLKAELPEFIKVLRELPEKKKFDTHFTLSPKAVPYRRVTLPLTPEISLSYDEGISKMSDKIWASKTKDGDSVLVIAAPNPDAQFTFKEDF